MANNIYIFSLAENLFNKFFVIAFLFFLPNYANAGITDTVKIEEVSVIGQNKKYQVGAKIISIGEGRVEQMSDGNLETLLRSLTTIAVKSDAGTMSNIRLRGTSPNHTSVNFEGINLNSKTLGQANLSYIPLYFFDNICLQYGSASVVNGSGSIGGSIHLDTKTQWQNGIKTELKTSAGSFGEQFYGAKIFIGNGKTEWVTKAYYFYKQNNFTFLKEQKDFVSGKYINVVDTQHNAAINNMAIMQQFAHKFNNHNNLKLVIWAENNWHQAQQNVSTNYSQPNYSEQLNDKALRFWASLNNNKNKLKYSFATGYVYDYQVYQADTNNVIKLNRLIGNFNAEYQFLENSKLKIGINPEAVIPNVYAYSSVLGTQYTTDIYASYLLSFFNRIQLSFNIRKSYITNFNAPFTPAIGTSVKLFSTTKSNTTLLANIGKSYRVPTFNDRFWIPGGNPNLKPENGTNFELGLKHNVINNNYSVNTSVHGYYMDINNWILWRNIGSYFQAENIQRVISKGIELQSDTKIKLANINYQIGFNYALTSTQRVESKISSDAINRQMEYVPLHNFSAFSSILYKKFTLFIDVNALPWMYSNETEDQIIDGYCLLNIAIAYNYSINNHHFNAQLKANNVLNVNYQSSFNYAMPRVNYKLSLTYTFNKTNKLN